MHTNQIECPQCGTSIDVSSALAEHLRKENEATLSEERLKLRQAKEAIDARQGQVESEVQKKLSEQLATEKAILAKELATEKVTLAKTLAGDLDKQYQQRLESMNKELESKSEQLKKLNILEAQNLALAREKGELESKYKLEAQKQINDSVAQERQNVRKQVEEENELNKKELEKTIHDLGQKLKDAQKRAEQGSMQLQGEVQELAIEEFLATEFPFDTISEIQKGVRGGDCIQTVNTRQSIGCGTIYYESKRARNFGGEWIAKFKEDIRQKNADIGVLVTEVYPTGMTRMGMKEGIWICSFPEFKALCFVLRDTLIRVDKAVTTSKNKGDKMGLLYDYMMGNEFKLQLESIVEAFVTLQSELASEKRAMARIWKKREKQINRVIISTSELYGSVQDIAGAALPTIDLLALPGSGSIAEDDGEED